MASYELCNNMDFYQIQPPNKYDSTALISLQEQEKMNSDSKGEVKTVSDLCADLLLLDLITLTF